MFKLAVWAVAIALQIVGLGIISPRAADEPVGSSLTPVTVAALVQPAAPAPRAADPHKALPLLSFIDPNARTTSARPYNLFKRLAACLKAGELCSNDSQCCSRLCTRWRPSSTTTYCH
jgi:hypothetical protein